MRPERSGGLTSSYQVEEGTFYVGVGTYTHRGRSPHPTVRRLHHLGCILTGSVLTCAATLRLAREGGTNGRMGLREGNIEGWRNGMGAQRRRNGG